MDTSKRLALIDSGEWAKKNAQGHLSTPPMLEAVLTSGTPLNAYGYCGSSDSLSSDRFKRWEGRSATLPDTTRICSNWEEILDGSTPEIKAVLVNCSDDTPLRQEIVSKLNERRIHVCLMPPVGSLSESDLKSELISVWYPMRRAPGIVYAKRLIDGNNVDITSMSIMVASPYYRKFMSRVVLPYLDVGKLLLGEVEKCYYIRSPNNVFMINAQHANGANGIYTFDGNGSRNNNHPDEINIVASDGTRLKVNWHQCIISNHKETRVFSADSRDFLASIEFLDYWLRKTQNHRFHYEYVPSISTAVDTERLLRVFQSEEDEGIWRKSEDEHEDERSTGATGDSVTVKKKMEMVRDERAFYMVCYYTDLLPIPRKDLARLIGRSEMTIWRWSQLDLRKKVSKILKDNFGHTCPPKWLLELGYDEETAKQVYSKIICVLLDLVEDLVGSLKNIDEMQEFWFACQREFPFDEVSPGLLQKMTEVCTKHNVSPPLLFKAMTHGTGSKPSRNTGITVAGY